MSNVHYTLSLASPNAHLFAVELTFSSQVGQSYQLSLPAWLPGSYMIRDFAKNIISLHAESANGAAVDIEKLDKQNWRVIATDEKVTVRYQIYAFDQSVRTAYLDNQRGFFNGSSVFLSVDELAGKPCQLTLIPFAEFSQWRVATGLTRAKNTEKFAWGDYVADDYQHLIDCPVALGDFDCTEFEVEGVRHHLVFTSNHYGDTQRLANDVAKLCQHHVNLFGEIPFNEYWFITHLLENGFGGLEHKNSTILQASRFDLPNPQRPEELTDEYKTFLSLCSHEYFHAWNVCRIKPKEFTPYALGNEVYTEQLWAYEGITSYYDDFSLYRAGIISFDDYLKLLSKTATRVYRGKGETKQSVAESSFYTWTKFYKQGPDAANNIVSYYTKGSLIALWLDISLRTKTNNQYSLDTLMRELWIHFGRPGLGTQQHDFVNIVNILSNDNLGDILLSHIEQADKFELVEILNQVGVKVNKSKFAKLNSLDTKNTEAYIPYLGAMYAKQSLGVKITSVSEDSPAEKAGLTIGDILIAVDNMKASEASLTKLANHISANTPVSCLYFRDDQLISSEIAFEDSPLAAIELSVVDEQQIKQWQQF